jgi:hypothetical protein
MVPIIPKPPISRERKRAALAVAVVVDLIQVPGFAAFGEGALSPFQDALDVITAIVLMAICGFKWQFVLAFGLELVPVATLFPTWTAMVLTLPSAAPGAAPPVQVSATVAPREGASGGDGSKAIVDVEGVVAPPVQGPPSNGR